MYVTAIEPHSQLEKNMTVNANTPPLKPFLDMMIEEMKKDAGIQSQKFQR